MNPLEEARKMEKAMHDIDRGIDEEERQFVENERLVRERMLLACKGASHTAKERADPCPETSEKNLER